MTPKRHSPQQPGGSVWEPMHDILEGVEQAVAGNWYPARRVLLSRLSEAAKPQLAAWVPEADVEEGPREISVSFALPGVGKPDIHVQVTEETLTISGRRREEADAVPEAGRREIPRGEFLRRVRLPAEVKPESAKAVYRDGVLRVTLARTKIQAGRSVKIE
ncbi:MAG: Hsp20/alpha crystallin family protein [Elusimicrobiota bacterium]